MDCPSRNGCPIGPSAQPGKPRLLLRLGNSEACGHHDPLRRRTNPNTMNIQLRPIAAKPPKTKKSPHDAFVTLTGRRLMLSDITAISLSFPARHQLPQLSQQPGPGAGPVQGVRRGGQPRREPGVGHPPARTTASSVTRSAGRTTRTGNRSPSTGTRDLRPPYRHRTYLLHRQKTPPATTSPVARIPQDTHTPLAMRILNIICCGYRERYRPMPPGHTNGSCRRLVPAQNANISICCWRMQPPGGAHYAAATSDVAGESYSDRHIRSGPGIGAVRR
jgi:hypothetical protein